MEVAVGIILCLSVLLNIVICVLCYILYIMYNSNEKAITDICKIDDSLVEIKEYLGADFDAYNNQN